MLTMPLTRLGYAAGAAALATLLLLGPAAQAVATPAVAA
jgi:hypothetical protein